MGWISAQVPWLKRNLNLAPPGVGGLQHRDWLLSWIDNFCKRWELCSSEAVEGLIQRSLRLMEELQINLMAPEQAVIYTLLFFFGEIFRCPLFCIQHYRSYFLFLVCICLFKSLSQTGQEWDRGEVTRAISQIGDISQVLWWKKNPVCICCSILLIYCHQDEIFALYC